MIMIASPRGETRLWLTITRNVRPMRGTKQDISQRAIRMPPISIRNGRNSAPTGNLPRAVCGGYHKSRSDTHLNGLAELRLKPVSVLQHETLGDVGVGSKCQKLAVSKQVRKYPSKLEIDGEFKFGWRLHRQVGRFLALEDAIDVARRAMVAIDDVGAI